MSLKGLIISVFQKLKKLSTTLLGIHTQKKCQLECKNLRVTTSEIFSVEFKSVVLKTEIRCDRKKQTVK